MIQDAIINSYLEIPYKENGTDRNGIDCWNFTKLFYKEILGIKLQEAEIENWDRVSEPQEFDVIVFKNEKGIMYHTGIFLGNGQFIQCIKAGVVKSNVKEKFWKDKIEGFFRYKNVN